MRLSNGERDIQKVQLTVFDKRAFKRSMDFSLWCHSSDKLILTWSQTKAFIVCLIENDSVYTLCPLKCIMSSQLCVCACVKATAQLIRFYNVHKQIGSLSKWFGVENKERKWCAHSKTNNDKVSSFIPIPLERI